ncbi:hypothetical protein [Pelagicoccus mobilis]|uniref:Uncharacterized protein n=1 Tax=Pelagicoccus mobilis TaxID=415221 RepID=A0A934VJF7_9BACT|nr:hypothetical protein [Pelagicoccus mobilis]MBK1875571.1 hypothetical protein [Pelagicoccus mobilis]
MNPLSFRVTLSGILLLAVLAPLYFWADREPRTEENDSTPSTKTAPTPTNPELQDSTQKPPTGLEEKATTAAPEPPRASAIPITLEGIRRLDIGKQQQHHHLMQRWEGRIKPEVKNWRQLGYANGTVLDFPLPGQSPVSIQIGRLERFGPNKGVFVGNIKDHKLSNCLFSYVNDSTSGMIKIPTQRVSWEFYSNKEGGVTFDLIDLNSLAACTSCSVD